MFEYLSLINETQKGVSEYKGTVSLDFVFNVNSFNSNKII